MGSRGLCRPLDEKQVSNKQPGRAGQGRAGQGRAGQGRAGQGRAGGPETSVGASSRAFGSLGFRVSGLGFRFFCGVAGRGGWSRGRLDLRKPSSFGCRV